MTPTPQSEHKGSNTAAILIVVGLAVLAICMILAICLGPLGVYAWLMDRELDCSNSMSTC
jgi:hypothetical protein